MTKKKKKESWKEKRRQAAIKHQKALEAERLRRERQPKKKQRMETKQSLSHRFSGSDISRHRSLRCMAKHTTAK